MLKTGISSIFNEALFSPYFLVVGILSLPLFFMVYLYGRDFVERLGWNNRNYENQVGFWTGLVIALWLMLFGGNYSVILDFSLLPFGIAFVLFLLMILVSQKLVQLHYLEQINKKTIRWALFFGIILMAVFSAVPTWHGILLQISAVFCGMIVGCRSKKNISVVPILTIIMLIVSVLMLMQAEFFRFGKLGDLTFVHCLGLVLVGFLGTGVLVTRYTNVCGNISKSTYAKIKWLSRVIIMLLLACLITTQQSVPFYVILIMFFGFSQWLLVRFSGDKPTNLSGQLFGLLLISFGLLTTCPLISALGIVYMVFCPGRIKLKDVLCLL